MRSGLRGMLAAAVLAMSAAGPALAEPRGIALQPGSGIVKRDRPPRRRKDASHQAAAQAKRERKNAKRLRDWKRCLLGHSQGCTRVAWPFTAGVIRGK